VVNFYVLLQTLYPHMARPLVDRQITDERTAGARIANAYKRALQATFFVSAN